MIGDGCFCCWLVFISSTLYVIYILIRYFLERRILTDLTTKAIFITGCDTGFGHDLVIKCLEHGMPVYAACLTASSAEQLQIKCRWLPGKLYTLTMDVRDTESVTKAKLFVEQNLQETAGKAQFDINSVIYVACLHGIVNNAGIAGNAAPDDWLTLDDYHQVVDVNTFGVIRVSHAFKRLIKQSKGRIVTAASICARVCLPGTAPYTVSKHAVSAYCDTLRLEMKEFGVHCAILEPGFFRTPITNVDQLTSKLDRVWQQLDDQTKLEYGHEFFENIKKQSGQFLATQSSDRTDRVVDAYFHALTAVHPRKRYQIGYDAIFGFIPFSFLPTDVQDFIFSIATYLLNIPKPAVVNRRQH